MKLEERILAFSKLGADIQQLNDVEVGLWAEEARRGNGWFTEINVKNAIKGISRFLNEEDLRSWVKPYELEIKKVQKVGVVMAGNIPLVGFHDFLSVLISGNQLHAKLSSSDNVLFLKIVEKLIEIEPRFKEQIVIAERITGMDAVIATGSDNSARYFNYYFSKIPHIIRQNRVSVGILNGNESLEDLNLLGNDVFLYFGLGCRNVAKLYVPEGYQFNKLFEAIDNQRYLIDLHKYYNNYDYNKSIYLVNKTPFLENDFLLLTESESLTSPISVVFFEYYKSAGELSLKLESKREKIQAIVSKDGWFDGSVTFGQAQFPALSDYADGIDTLEFLQSLQK